MWCGMELDVDILVNLLFFKYTVQGMPLRWNVSNTRETCPPYERDRRMTLRERKRERERERENTAERERESKILTIGQSHNTIKT